MLKLSEHQGAAYVHVDDGLLLSKGSLDGSPPMCDQAMFGTAEFFEQLGLATPDRLPDSEVCRIIGYEVVRSPAALTVPLDKMAWLHQALIDITGPGVVDTGSFILYVVFGSGGLYYDESCFLFLPQCFASWSVSQSNEWCGGRERATRSRVCEN